MGRIDHHSWFNGVKNVDNVWEPSTLIYKWRYQQVIVTLFWKLRWCNIGYGHENNNSPWGECCGGAVFHTHWFFGDRPQVGRHSLRRLGLVLRGHIFCEDLIRRRNYRERSCVEQTPRTGSQTHGKIWQDCAVWQEDCTNLITVLTRLQIHVDTWANAYHP